MHPHLQVSSKPEEEQAPPRKRHSAEGRSARDGPFVLFWKQRQQFLAELDSVENRDEDVIQQGDDFVFFQLGLVCGEARRLRMQEPAGITTYASTSSVASITSARSDA
jgi:hypothetical protein